MFKLTHVTRRGEKTLIHNSAQVSGGLEVKPYGHDSIRIDVSDIGAPTNNFYVAEMSLDAASRLAALLVAAINMQKSKAA